VSLGAKHRGKINENQRRVSENIIPTRGRAVNVNEQSPELKPAPKGTQAVFGIFTGVSLIQSGFCSKTPWKWLFPRSPTILLLLKSNKAFS
jgi:hypothetical protein